MRQFAIKQMEMVARPLCYLLLLVALSSLPSSSSLLVEEPLLLASQPEYPSDSRALVGKPGGPPGPHGPPGPPRDRPRPRPPRPRPPPPPPPFPREPEWTHQNQIAWPVDFAECAGRSQSPINIERTLAIGDPRLELRFHNYEYPRQFKVENDGHTVKLQLESRNEPNMINTGDPTIEMNWTIDGAKGNNKISTYKLDQIHFHWSDTDRDGSEHALDGRRYAMEIHLVHKKVGGPEYKPGPKRESLVVLGVLVESHRFSDIDLSQVLDILPFVNGSSQAYKIELDSLFHLLPSDLSSFYSYSGSLTTPPCSEVVDWVVFSNRVRLQGKQVDQFRSLYKADRSRRMGPNVRSLQPLNNRLILSSSIANPAMLKLPVYSQGSQQQQLLRRPVNMPLQTNQLQAYRKMPIN